MYFRFGALFKSLQFSCNIVYPFSIFVMFFWLPYFRPKNVPFLWHLIVGMFSCHSLPIVDRIFFRCFGKSCFICIVLPFVDISLIYLLSPALSGFFPHVILLFFLVLPVPFCSRLFQRLSLVFFVFFFIILVCFHSFLFAFPVEFPIPVLTVSSCFLRGSQFSHKLILHLHRLVHLTWLYYSLVCKVVCDLFYSFLS